MEIKNMTSEELETRKAEIASLVDAEDADLDALTEEVRSINSELQERRDAELKKAELRNAVASEEVGETIETIESIQEKRNMKTVEEIRSSHEYNVAYANYIKTNNDAECRALLTENANAQYGANNVPVPTYVEGRVATAWERARLLDKAKKTYFKGNVKQSFERSASDAVVHAEGSGAVTEEELLLGIVTMVPETIKKWISVSTESVEYGMGGEGFLDYIYDELTYRVALKAQNELIGLIENAPTTASASAVSVAEHSVQTLTLADLYVAIGMLNPEAQNLTAVMSRAMEAQIRALQIGANFAVDPLANIDIVHANIQDEIIIGDFGIGAQVNLPDGDSIRVLRDDYTLATQDLVRFIAHKSVGLGLVSDKAFVRIVIGD